MNLASTNKHILGESKFTYAVRLQYPLSGVLFLSIMLLVIFIPRISRIMAYKFTPASHMEYPLAIWFASGILIRSLQRVLTRL